MITIKDYLMLKKIFNYLENKKDEEIRENNGFSNQPVEELTEMQERLGLIIYKLENEDKE